MPLPLHTWRHERYVVVLVDDGPRDVGVQDVEAEGEDPQLDQPVVPLRLLRRPPTHDAQGYVEDGGQALQERCVYHFMRTFKAAQ